MALLQSSQVISLPKLPIPVVSHLVRDKDVVPVEGEEFKPLDLDKIIKLFVDPHSYHYVERHLHCLKKICKHYKRGFLLKDIAKIIKILNVLSDKIEHDQQYASDMSNIIALCSYPYLKERASDELQAESIISECVANLGYLLRTPNNDVRLAICLCIQNLITLKNVPQEYANTKRCTKQFLVKAIKNSDLPETLVKSLALMENSIELRLKMLQILQSLSKEKSNCDQMLNAECASRLVLKLNYPVKNEELLFRSIEILWNLVEFCANKEDIATQLNSLTAINQIRESFLEKILHGYSNYDRQVRNDILLISSNLASVMPKLPFVETGMLREILLFVTYPEIKSNHPLIKNLKLTTCYEDFELKKLLFNFLINISRNQCALQLFSESSIILALLTYVKPVETSRDTRDWTVSQFEELQLHAMATLCILIPVLLKDYFSCHGSTRLLLFLEWCTNKQNDYNGFGQSFHGKGGRGTKRAQLKYCLRVIRSIVSTGSEQAIQDFTDQDILSTLTNILINAASNDEPDDEIDIEIQTDMLFILSCICENDLHRKELFGTTGVDILIKYLKKKPELIWNGIGYRKLIIHTIDCIWSTVVGCMLNENYFMQNEGVFYLLDIIEASPKSMQSLVLGCLLDLSDNLKSLNHLVQWEGKNSVKIAHLLCNLWRTEERDLGVSRDSDGIIVDHRKPLLTKEQEDEPIVSLPTNVASKAIVEVSENMRAKIYGLFCKLGFSELPGLTQEDHVTLCIIENYLDFKLGEVFKEINVELSLEGVMPIPPDQEALDTILRAADERVISVNMTQKHMTDTYGEQEEMQEKEFYYEMKKNFNYKEKKRQEWKEYVLRCSKYSYLETQKEKQVTAIEDSRLPERETIGYQTIHNLEIPNLAVTAFCGPIISIDSTPPELLQHRSNKNRIEL